MKLLMVPGVAAGLRFGNSLPAPEYTKPTPMEDLMLLAWVLLLVNPGAASSPWIRKIEVEGNLRVPSGSILRAMNSKPNTPLDQTTITGDIHRLHGMQLFRNVEIRALPGAGGVDVVVHVREWPFISWFSIEGVDDILEVRIHELLRKQGIEVRPAAPYDPVSAARAARVVRSWLLAREYPLAEVGVECEDKGTGAIVRLRIRSGPRLGMGAVAFTGNNSIPSAELRSLVRGTRASSWWASWYKGGYYAPERLGADLDCIRRHYRSQGFARVAIGKPVITVQRSGSPTYSPRSVTGRRHALHISIPINEGDVYLLRSVGVEGDARAASHEVALIARTLGHETRYDRESLEIARKKMSEALGRAGYPLARVELEESVDEQALTVRAMYKIDTGDPTLLGRIEFEGNQRVPDKFLRRELRIGEGQVFDSSKVDESIKRLNSSGLIEELRREDVLLRENPAAGTADMTFRVKERPPQGIYGTGGTPGAAGGYLGILYTAFNLLGLGERLSLQLDGGVASSNLLLTLAGQHFLGSPFTLGLSVFDRYSGINVAGIVPDASDLVRLLTDHRKGVRLAGSYSMGARARTGIGLQVDHAALEYGDGGRSTPRLTHEFSTLFVYDSTLATGSAGRGFRFAADAALSCRSFLGSAESARASGRITRYLADPWTDGRNSFALDVNLAAIRPTMAGGIAPEKRLHLGGEILRGFRRGGLGSWAFGRDGPAGGLKPVGADTAVSVSAEYHVPIAGPLSGVAFVDLGWTRLDSAAISEPGLRLVGATNALLRASTGGELRLALPVINQPARLIVAWNPLRLNRILREGASIGRIADRRGLVSFALGGASQ